MKLLQFDLDGVLVDTEEIHHSCLLNSINKNAGISKNELTHIIKKDGTSTKQKLNVLKQVYNLSEKILFDIEKDKQEVVIKKLQNITIDFDKFDMLNFLRQNFLLTLVSNSRSENVYKILEHTKIKDFFSLILTPSNNFKPKPDPEMYSYGITFFNVNPYETLIIEDSPAGIDAGIKTGAFVLQINSIEEVTLSTLTAAIYEANNINSYGGKRNTILKTRL